MPYRKIPLFTVFEHNENKDKLFGGSLDSGKIGIFRFDAKVARVFNDMIIRSVPGYAQALELIARLAAAFAPGGSKVYDLGCSTGNALRELAPLLDESVELVACDSSQAMLDRCRENLAELAKSRKIEFLLHDLGEALEMPGCSVAIASLVLQFLEPARRKALVSEIHGQLAPGGAFIVFEKIASPDPRLQELNDSWHQDFKRAQGYSDTEIARKRQALETVLIPLTMEQNLEMLRAAGFGRIEVFFCVANFFAAVALKDGESLES